MSNGWIKKTHAYKMTGVLGVILVVSLVMMSVVALVQRIRKGQNKEKTFASWPLLRVHYDVEQESGQARVTVTHMGYALPSGCRTRLQEVRTRCQRKE